MAYRRLEFRDVKEAARGRWPEILREVGVEPEHLDGKGRPCPGCGGDDRFTFDDLDGRGTWLCRQGGSGTVAGDGFDLLFHVHGWPVKTAMEEVAWLLGLQPRTLPTLPKSEPAKRRAPQPRPPAKPTPRAWRILKETAPAHLVPEVRNYLANRLLWPLPGKVDLLAHAALDWWNATEKRVDARCPALIARVTDSSGELVTLHVTWVEEGQKLSCQAPRKLIGPVHGRASPAVRLMPTGPVLGIAEGIESALSASVLLGIPCWSALNASLLARWEPPEGVEKVVILADQDFAGIRAAGTLLRNVLRSGRCDAELQPSPTGNDWNDRLVEVGPPC